MSSSIEQAIIKPKLGYHVTEKECLRTAFWDRADSLAQMSLMQVSLYHHQLTQQFVAHACTVWPHEQSTGAWNFAWYYASVVVYAVLDDFWGLELPRTRTRTRTCGSRTRTRTWKLVLEDKDFPRGQQHWYQLTNKLAWSQYLPAEMAGKLLPTISICGSQAVSVVICALLHCGANSLTHSVWGRRCWYIVIIMLNMFLLNYCSLFAVYKVHGVAHVMQEWYVVGS